VKPGAYVAVVVAYGTLSEVALALKTGVPVIGLSTWEIEGVQAVDTPESAVARALAAVRRRREVGTGA
jgi:hypothetical protein